MSFTPATKVLVNEFQSPFGILGKLADWLFLKRYIQQLLQKRNIHLKQAAELLPRFSEHKPVKEISTNLQLYIIIIIRQ